MPAARALVLALWPLAARADFVRGASLPSRAVAEEPLHRGVPRRLQGFEPSTGAEGLQWTAPAQPAALPMATPAPAPVAGSVLAPTSPLVVPGMLQHFGLDCWTACGEKAGYCKWCGDGNSCCRRADPNDPEECKTASVFLTLHHECVQTLPPAPPMPTVAPLVPGIVATASPTPPPVGLAPQERSAPVAATTTVTTTAQVSTAEPIPTGPPTAAPPQQMVPAAEALLGTTVTTTPLPPTTVPPAANQALTVAPLATVPPIPPAVVPTTTTIDQLAVNELYQDRRDRFIRAPAGRATWFQDAQTLTKHLVRFRCKACGEPSPCHDYRTVSKEYIQNLTLGEDFQCDLLDDPSPHGFRAAPFPTTTFSQTYTTTWHATSTTTTTTTVAAGAFGGWSWFAILGLVLLVCCCAAVAVAAFMAMNGGGRKSKKKNRTRGVKEDTASNGNNDEDQVPLVFGQEDPAYANASFSSHMSQRSDHSHGHHHGHREHAAAMAPTYTAMTPQMAQGPMNAQMAMQAQMPTQTNMQQMPLTTTPWVQPQPMPMQPTQVMPGTYTGLPTQAALAPPMQQAPYMPMGYPQQQGQEMELVTVTPGGLAVTPLAPGQQLPPGVPVVSQQNLM